MSAILLRLATHPSLATRLPSLGCRHLATLKATADSHISTNDNKATPEQLTNLETILQNSLPNFFNTPHPFDLYTKDVTLVDNIKNVRLQGLSQYILRVALIKLYYDCTTNYRKVELLNLVKNLEESCIKIRWRIVTKPGLTRLVLSLFTYHNQEFWKDGISTLHVDKDGKIYCHVCDNIDVDTSKDTKPATKTSAIKNPFMKGLNV